MKKKVKVVILPTKKANKGCIMLHPNNRLTINKDDSGFTGYTQLKPQHLYFLSDEEIKEGDWVYNELTGVGKYLHKGEFEDSTAVVIYNKQDYEVSEDFPNIKKIIATTDESLYTERESWFSSSKSLSDNKEKIQLPRPSNEFLQAYCRTGGIDEVEVEYKVKVKNRFGEKHFLIEDDSKKYIKTCTIISYELKIAPDNTISIYPTKDSWTREEVFKLFSELQYEMSQQIIGNRGSERIIPIEWIRTKI